MNEMTEPKKPSLIEKTALESGVFAASVIPVAGLCIGLQNIKVEKQLTRRSYPEAFRSLMAQGSRRLGQGYLPYTGRNMTTSAISGPALMVTAAYMKEHHYSPVTAAFLTTLSATAIETITTAYVEGKELNATKGLHVPEKYGQAVAQTTKYTARILPYMYSRNLAFWAASIATNDVLKDESCATRNVAGAVTGMVAGAVSMPFDTILTSMYGSKKTLPAIIKEHGVKGLLNGATIRAGQVGAYTAATVAAISFLERLKASRANNAGSAKSRD